MPNIFVRNWANGWVPDADEENAPSGTLLRADNVVRDKIGAIALRQGSQVLFTDQGVDLGPIHSLRSFIINDSHRIFSGAGDRLFLDGVDLGLTGFNGSGDMALGTDSYQVFIARGDTKRKYDGSNYNRWDIPAPSIAPTLTAAAVVTQEIASFDIAESPAFVLTEGTSAFVTAADLTTANGALKLTTDSGTGRSSAYRKWSSDQDFLNFKGMIGGDADLFDMYTALGDPSKTDAITVMFGLGTGTDPFRDDYYYFDFNVRDKNTVNIKDANSAASSVYAAQADATTQALTPEEVTNVQSPEQVIGIMSTRDGRYSGSRSRERKDAVQSSPAWGHFSVTRGQFNRVGSTSGRDWTTIRGFKIVVSQVSGATYDASFDSAIWYGGGVRSLTGKFKARYRFARDFGAYVELSPISPISLEITLNQQGLNIVIPALAIQGSDVQVNQCWIYLYGGYLNTYYRVAVVGSSAKSSTMGIDEFAGTGNGSIDAADRTRLSQLGLTIPGYLPNLDLTVVLRTSEVEALTANVRLEPGGVGAPDNIIAIEGPVNNRMYALTSEGWLYPSLPESPSNFSVYHVIDLRKWGTPLWMKIGGGGLHVGMTEDIIRIDGTGDENEERSECDLYATPLSIGNPPVDSAVFADGHNLIYRAADGLMTLSGSSDVPVTQDGMLFPWRQVSRHGVPGLNTISGRFRIAVDNHILYMLSPEGSDTDSTAHVYRYTSKGWDRFIYPTRFVSLDRGQDGRLLAGDNVGRVWQLETADSVDAGALIPVTILSPILDNGSPLQAKSPMDIQLGMDTGGSVASLNILVNGSSSVAWAVNVASQGGATYRASSISIGDFNRLQYRISGSFSQFVLRHFNLSYRSHPQQTMVVDTGYLTVPNNREIGWIGKVEVSARSPYHLEIVPVFDDVEKDPISLPVVPGKTSVYTTTLRRGQNKGRRPLIRVRTISADGSGEIGAEIYWIRVHFAGTGNRTEKEILINYGSVQGEAIT